MPKSTEEHCLEVLYTPGKERTEIKLTVEHFILADDRKFSSVEYKWKPNCMPLLIEIMILKLRTDVAFNYSKWFGSQVSSIAADQKC